MVNCSQVPKSLSGSQSNKLVLGEGIQPLWNVISLSVRYMEMGWGQDYSNRVFLEATRLSASALGLGSALCRFGGYIASLYGSLVQIILREVEVREGPERKIRHSA
jgi:hypothetical protein